MIADLPLVDQVWMFALIVAFIVACLAILALLGPAFVRDVVGLFRGDHDGPGPTDPEFESDLARLARTEAPIVDPCLARFAERLDDDRRRFAIVRARDREIQELQ